MPMRWKISSFFYRVCWEYIKKELRTIVILNSFYIFSTYQTALASSELRWALAVAVFEILS